MVETVLFMVWLLWIFQPPTIHSMNITVVTVAFTDSPTYGYNAMMPTYDAIFSFIARKYPLVHSKIKRMPPLNLAQYMPADGYSYSCTFAYEVAMQYIGAYYQKHPEIFQPNSTEVFPFILTADWCDDAQTELARFATAANVFLLTLNPANGIFSQFPNFPVMTELGPLPGAKMVAGVTAVLLKYGWTKNLGFWCPTNGMAWPFIFCDIFIKSDLYNKIGAEQFYIVDPEIKEFSRAQYRKILNDMRYRTRVILVFLFHRLLREFMITAHEMNMTNGDYVFLTLAFQLSPDSPYPFTWKANDKDDGKAFQAYQSLIASSDSLVNWNAMKDFVSERARISADVYNITLPPERMYNQATALMYDLLTSFAEGVNRSLGNDDYFQPRTFAKRLKEQMYSRETSSTKLDKNGGAAFRVPILRLNTESGEIEVQY
ncbi:uncharacterized protein LOC129586483 [Paramacrobiotus metropolitanus]|uniref:uncharacterized protein LOC129586483 n=1 Tax=Paramacrobiotus metropolitanus TaxID=2943436 RepID=UPI0024459FA9|nr:uncharacterized protein LOC129586483 [Paramacrobiotus metropolitanus]